MKTNVIKLLFVLVALYTAPVFAAQSDPIGKITNINGLVYKASGGERALQMLHSHIYANDVVETAVDGGVEITFVDDMQVTIGGESSLVIDEYVFDPENPDVNKTELTLLKSSFHYVSGLLAKYDPEDVKINLDFGSIGIRGTEIWRDMLMDGDNSPVQCRVFVDDGAVVVSNDAGRVALAKGQGTTIAGLDELPTRAEFFDTAIISEIKSKSTLTGRSIP